MARPKHPPCPHCGKALYKSPQPAIVKPTDPWAWCRNEACEVYGKRLAKDPACKCLWSPVHGRIKCDNCLTNERMEAGAQAALDRAIEVFGRAPAKPSPELVKALKILLPAEMLEPVRPDEVIRVIYDADDEASAERIMGALRKLKGHICSFVAWPGITPKIDAWSARAYYELENSTTPAERPGLKVRRVPRAEADAEKAAGIEAHRADIARERAQVLEQEDVQPRPEPVQELSVPPSTVSGSDDTPGVPPCGWCGLQGASPFGYSARVHTSVLDASAHFDCSEVASEAFEACPSGCKGAQMVFGKSVRAAVCNVCGLEVDRVEHTKAFIRRKMDGKVSKSNSGARRGDV